MSQHFSHQVPDERAFLHTLQIYLEARGQAEIVALLQGGTCSISPSSTYSGNRWNALSTTVTFSVPKERLGQFSGKTRRALWLAADAVMPKNAGLDVEGVQVVPFLEKPPSLDRARLFKDYGLVVIEFYDAARCSREPEAVVDDFLRRLEHSTM